MKDKKRILMYPSKPLGSQRRPFGFSFSGFEVIRKHFLKDKK